MNQTKSGKVNGVPRLQLFNCVHADCGATFTRKWRLEEHETVHTGARPHKCPEEGCRSRFRRRSDLSRHALKHKGKLIRCTVGNCSKTFYNPDNLKRHVRYAHGDKDKYFRCNQPNCQATFRKRRMLKIHLAEHGVISAFRCTRVGCGMTFATHIARRAHERKHKGYRCPYPECLTVERTWGRLLKHKAKHPASYSCVTCKKTFTKRDAVRRHKRTHALQKPVLLCPSEGCQAYFSTTFNLQHHIRKVHLKLLPHQCSFTGCTKTFAMRDSLVRHMLRHDPDAAKPKRQKRSSKSWQKRLEGRNRRTLVEEDLRRLFALRLRFSRRTKLEANLSGLFNERKIPHYVDPEVNLRDLFNIKPPQKVKG
ncbi:P43 5S RNA-binding protein-like [Trichomycterus rosablanca]|uniref:P43 5S RNA-binding protein-like n=1 Tax=Trichomycterus rosablanca TaxID=2290929 RepID=UPI002F35A7AC